MTLVDIMHEIGPRTRARVGKPSLVSRWLFVILLTVTGTAQAELNIVATTPSLGMLAREVGGASANVTVLTTPEQDVHQVQARPSIMAKLRRADLLFAMGAELEAGWVGPAVRGAANPALLPTRPGYFEAAAQVDRLGMNKPLDRRFGDIHAEGNPHVTLDPLRAGTIAVALARRLGELDAKNATAYQQRAAEVQDRLRAANNALRSQVPSDVTAVLYHEDGDYFMGRMSVKVLGYLEPLPGVPPTARHLVELSTRMRGKQGVIFHTPYQSPDGPQWLAKQTGWPVAVLPIEPPMDADLNAYIAHLTRWSDALRLASSSG